MHDSFVFRYTHGYSQQCCSFWYVDALILLGERERAKAYFEDLLKCSNHLGLFSEHISLKTHELTGNFPQGYTYEAIIYTAMMIASFAALEKETGYLHQV